jgi:hypothetical protein
MNKTKKSTHKLSILLIVVVLIFSLLFGNIAAYAGTASGTASIYQTTYREYRAYNQVETLPGNYAYGFSYIGITNNTAPAGYLGSAPRLFKDDGLYATGSVSFNTSTYSQNQYYSSITVAQGSSVVSGHYFNSYGTVRYYMPSGTTEPGYPARSPNQSA